MGNIPLMPTIGQLRYATAVLQDFPSPPAPPATVDRRCEECGAVLSQYNPGDVCRPCQERIRETTGKIVGDCGLPYGNGCSRYPDCFTCPRLKGCRANQEDPHTHIYSGRNDVIRSLHSRGALVPQLTAAFGLTGSAVRGVIRRSGLRKDRRA